MEQFSTMEELGSPAPNFSLPNTNPGFGTQTVSMKALNEHLMLLVVFICNHCPYVVHIRDSFVSFAAEYQEKRLAVVAICSNDALNYPGDSPEKMTEEAINFGYSFPYLYDESQTIAKAYHATCTPDFFLYNHERVLVYRGQYDGSRPGNGEPVTGRDLRRATDALLRGDPILAEQRPSVGCNIKWRSGEEPDYFSV
jgi:peroxiredoxin